MMATVPHITSSSGLRKFQADGFLFDRVYKFWLPSELYEAEVSHLQLSLDRLVVKCCIVTVYGAIRSTILVDWWLHRGLMPCVMSL